MDDPDRSANLRPAAAGGGRRTQNSGATTSCFGAVYWNLWTDGERRNFDLRVEEQVKRTLAARQKPDQRQRAAKGRQRVSSELLRRVLESLLEPNAVGKREKESDIDWGTLALKIAVQAVIELCRRQSLAETELPPWDDPASERRIAEALAALERLLLSRKHARLAKQRHRLMLTTENGRNRARDLELSFDLEEQQFADGSIRKTAEQEIADQLARLAQQRLEDCLQLKALIGRALAYIESEHFVARADRRANVMLVAKHLRDHWYRFDDYLNDDGDLNRAALARGIEETSGAQIDRTTVASAWNDLVEIFRACSSAPTDERRRA